MLHYHNRCVLILNVQLCCIITTDLSLFCNVQECCIITTDLSLFCNVQKCCIITTDLSPKLLSIRTFCSNLYTHYKAYSIVVCCQFATSKGTGFLHVQSQILDSVKRQVFTDRSLKEVWSATRVFLLSFVRLSTVIITEGCWGGGGGGVKGQKWPHFLCFTCINYIMKN